MQTNRALKFTVLVGLVLGLTTPALADPIFTVTLDTSPLSGTQTLAFGLTDGDFASNNTVTLTAFDFGGGSATVGTNDCTLGGSLSGLGCSGDLASGVGLNDSDFVAFFTQQFVPGSSLSFALNATNNFAGGFPDQFAMYLCDASFSTCYSDDAATGAMLLVNLTGGVLAPSSFTLYGAGDQGLAAPVVTTAVPEPGTLMLLAVGLTSARLFRQRKKAASGA